MQSAKKVTVVTPALFKLTQTSFCVTYASISQHEFYMQQFFCCHPYYYTVISNYRTKNFTNEYFLRRAGLRFQNTSTKIAPRSVTVVKQNKPEVVPLVRKVSLKINVWKRKQKFANSPLGPRTARSNYSYLSIGIVVSPSSAESG